MGLFGTIGSIIGGGSVKKGLTKAAIAQQYSSNGQIANLDDALAEILGGFAPYTTLGASSSQAYADLLGIGGREASGASQGNVDWGAYVRGNPDALANWNAIKDNSDGSRFSGDIDEFGAFHWNDDGGTRDLSSFTSGAHGPLGAISADEAQAQAIANLEKSPLFTSLIRQGNEAILANASATGGLRGGNTIDRLTDFRADTLAQTIQSQLAGYQGGISTGLGATGSVANANLGVATSQNAATQSATDALIQKILGKAGVNSQNWSNVGGFLDEAASGGGFGKAVKTIGGLF